MYGHCRTPLCGGQLAVYQYFSPGQQSCVLTWSPWTLRVWASRSLCPCSCYNQKDRLLSRVSRSNQSSSLQALSWRTRCRGRSSDGWWRGGFSCLSSSVMMLSVPGALPFLISPMTFLISWIKYWRRLRVYFDVFRLQVLRLYLQALIGWGYPFWKFSCHLFI